jgi:hypothetical protein
MQTRGIIRENCLINYLLKIAKTTLTIAPHTTIHPETIVMMVGMVGIESVPSIIPDPTAKATMMPTIQIRMEIKFLSCIFIYLLLIFFL